MAKKRKKKGSNKKSGQAVRKTNQKPTKGQKTANKPSKTNKSVHNSSKSKKAQNKPKLSKEKEGAIHELLVALGLVKDKKQKKAQKYENYNVGQIRPVNTKETRGHNGYLITKSGTGEEAEFGYVSITHAKITDGDKNIKLLQNPNPNDTKDSHAVNKAKTAKASELGKQRKGWRLNKKDKKTLKNIFNKKKKK